MRGEIANAQKRFNTEICNGTTNTSKKEKINRKKKKKNKNSNEGKLNSPCIIATHLTISFGYSTSYFRFMLAEKGDHPLSRVNLLRIAQLQELL